MRWLSALLLVPLVLLWVFYVPKEEISHYEVLGVPRNATKDQLSSAFNNLDSQLQNDEKVLHAVHVLINEHSRENYDNFGVDEEGTDIDSLASSTTDLTVTSLNQALREDTPLLVQIYSKASRKSQDFSPVWERIAEKLEGLVKLGRVELSDVELAKQFAETNWSTRRSTFRNGIPALVAFPSGCKELSCSSRYLSDQLFEDTVLNWVATDILNLPRILYYSSQTLVPDFIVKSGIHKVKVIVFSETGERAAPHIRLAAKNYADYATFGLVLWRESESLMWKNTFGVESAPAIAIVRDPGVQPVAAHGVMDSSSFTSLIEEHKTHILPQLRSSTAAELGCDLEGRSKGESNASTCYCVVAAGKPGYNLDQLRSTMRLVKDELESEDGIEADIEYAAKAYKEDRLALTWLDGAAQKKYCYYFLSSETVQDTCGPRQYRDEVDVPKLFLIRFQEVPEEEQTSSSITPSYITNLWKKEEEKNFPSIMVARYNGSTDDAGDIATWISSTLQDGDKSDIPLFRSSSPPVLLPEDARPMLSTTSEAAYKAKSRASERIWGFIRGASDLTRDVRMWSTILVCVTVFVLMRRH